MEIQQYLYDLTDSGDAIVAYSMVSASGATVQLCNLGASILSFTIPNEGGCEADDILSACCVKGLVVDKEPFEERLWESRVEVNRVIMSFSYEVDGVGAMMEVVFDFDDDDTLEITYQACLEGAAAFDLSHRICFNLGGDATLEMDSVPSERADNIYMLRGARRGILSEMARVRGARCAVEILSSHPALRFDAEGLTTLQAPLEVVENGVRYVQKSLFRAIKLG